MAFSPGRGSSGAQRGLNGSATNPSRPGLQLRDEASLNILIPMGGGGEAFRDAGYTFPKPLIKIVGRPMLLHLLDNLQTRLGDVVWLVVPEALYAQYEATLCLSQEYPEVDIRVVTFNMKTRGAVETLFIGLRHMSETELNRRVVCLDCDTLYFSDVLGQFRGLPKENGACFYFVDQGSRAMYSYLRVGADDLVKEVREKNAISRMANVGAYGFPSARALRSYIQAVLDQPDRMMETYYVSNIINKMVKDDFHFVALNAEHCRQCGTPPQLEEFMAEVAAGQALQLPKRRFCFALDNVLVTAPLKPGDFSTVQPIEKNVQLVRELKQSGHHIIISTCRGMQEHGGNVGAVIAACGHQTLQTLKDLDIPYDEIHFGQPYADLYIDSSIACASVDTEKDVGWRLANFNRANESGMIAARHFNQVQIEGNYVVKTSARSVLRGEMFFYAHVPADIADIFPTLISSSEYTDPVPSRAPELAPKAAASAASTPAGRRSVLPSSATKPDAARDSTPDPVAAAAAAASAALSAAAPSAASSTATAPEDGISSMTLQRIDGVTFSHLATNRCLTPGRLTLMMQALLRMHRSEGDPSSRLPLDELDLPANYLPKVEKRFHAHKATYLALLPESEAMFERIQQELASYQSEKRWRYSHVIHGDPVFSNALLTDEGRVFLLDMRGEVGKALTLQGDMLYDLSKVYQSLLGYDFILLGIPLLERDAEILEELRQTFRAFVAEQYVGVALSDIIKLTAAHYFGIVPLHQNQDHRRAYLQTASALLSSIPKDD